MTWAAIGLALGLVAAAAERALLAKSLSGVTASDPVTRVGVAALLVAVVTAACLIPAIRTTRVDPANSMRAE